MLRINLNGKISLLDLIEKSKKKRKKRKPFHLFQTEINYSIFFLNLFRSLRIINPLLKTSHFQREREGDFGGSAKISKNQWKII